MSRSASCRACTAACLRSSRLRGWRSIAISWLTMASVSRPDESPPRRIPLAMAPTSPPSRGEVRVAGRVDGLAQRDRANDVALDGPELGPHVTVLLLEAQLVPLRVKRMEHPRRGFHLLEDRD